jgi:hypothetical protein
MIYNPASARFNAFRDDGNLLTWDIKSEHRLGSMGTYLAGRDLYHPSIPNVTPQE